MAKRTARNHPKILAVVLACCAACAAPAARAQVISAIVPSGPRVEISGGYAYFRANTVVGRAQLNLNGETGSVAVYVNPWLGFVGDIGFYSKSNIEPTGYSLTVSSYQAGPRVRFRNESDFTTFLQALVGVGRAGGTLFTRPVGDNPSPLGANNSLLFTVGGGVDWQHNPRIGIRVIQVEYLHSQFRNGSDNQQGNFRLSTGVILAFGNK
jgi:hypothetical protein